MKQPNKRGIVLPAIISFIILILIMSIIFTVGSQIGYGEMLRDNNNPDLLRFQMSIVPEAASILPQDKVQFLTYHGEHARGVIDFQPTMQAITTNSWKKMIREKQLSCDYLNNHDHDFDTLAKDKKLYWLCADGTEPYYGHHIVECKDKYIFTYGRSLTYGWHYKEESTTTKRTYILVILDEALEDKPIYPVKCEFYAHYDWELMEHIIRDMVKEKNCIQFDTDTPFVGANLARYYRLFAMGKDGFYTLCNMVKDETCDPLTQRIAKRLCADMLGLDDEQFLAIIDDIDTQFLGGIVAAEKYIRKEYYYGDLNRALLREVYDDPRFCGDEYDVELGIPYIVAVDETEEMDQITIHAAVLLAHTSLDTCSTECIAVKAMLSAYDDLEEPCRLPEEGLYQFSEEAQCKAYEIMEMTCIPMDDEASVRETMGQYADTMLDYIESEDYKKSFFRLVQDIHVAASVACIPLKLPIEQTRVWYPDFPKSMDEVLEQAPYETYEIHTTELNHDVGMRGQIIIDESWDLKYFVELIKDIPREHFEWMHNRNRIVLDNKPDGIDSISFVNKGEEVSLELKIYRDESMVLIVQKGIYPYRRVETDTFLFDRYIVHNDEILEKLKEAYPYAFMKLYGDEITIKNMDKDMRFMEDFFGRSDLELQGMTIKKRIEDDEILLNPNVPLYGQQHFINCLSNSEITEPGEYEMARIKEFYKPNRGDITFELRAGNEEYEASITAFWCGEGIYLDCCGYNKITKERTYKYGIIYAQPFISEVKCLVPFNQREDGAGKPVEKNPFKEIREGKITKIEASHTQRVKGRMVKSPLWEMTDDIGDKGDRIIEMLQGLSPNVIKRVDRYTIIKRYADHVDDDESSSVSFQCDLKQNDRHDREITISINPEIHTMIVRYYNQDYLICGEYYLGMLEILDFQINYQEKDREESEDENLVYLVPIVGDMPGYISSIQPIEIWKDKLDGKWRIVESKLAKIEGREVTIIIKKLGALVKSYDLISEDEAKFKPRKVDDHDVLEMKWIFDVHSEEGIAQLSIRANPETYDMCIYVSYRMYDTDNTFVRYYDLEEAKDIYQLLIN